MFSREPLTHSANAIHIFSAAVSLTLFTSLSLKDSTAANHFDLGLSKSGF